MGLNMKFESKLGALKMLWHLAQQATVQQWSYIMGHMKNLHY